VTGLEWIDGSDSNHKVYVGSRYQYGIKAYFARRTDPVSGAVIGGNVGDNYNLGIVGPLKTMVRTTSVALRNITPGTKSLSVMWDESPIIMGTYQLQIATNSGFTQNVKTVTITDPDSLEWTVKSLKSGTTYYARIRVYTVFEGTTYYGGWSNVKSCKVK
jgi:hypothetical protein